jgi:hypothetical protein
MVSLRSSNPEPRMSAEGQLFAWARRERREFTTGLHRKPTYLQALPYKVASTWYLATYSICEGSGAAGSS